MIIHSCKLQAVSRPNKFESNNNVLLVSGALVHLMLNSKSLRAWPFLVLPVSLFIHNFRESQKAFLSVWKNHKGGNKKSPRQTCLSMFSQMDQCLGAWILRLDVCFTGMLGSCQKYANQLKPT